MPGPMKLPDPLDLQPVIIDGRPLHTHGWRHGDFIYAYTTEPDAVGRYHAVTLSLRSGEAVAGTNFATRDEAEGKAVVEYGAVAFPGGTITWAPKDPPPKT